MNKLTGIIFCRCSVPVIQDSKLDEIGRYLEELDAQMIEMRDLCSFAIHEKNFLADAINSVKNTIVIACYPRAVRNMIIQAGIDPENIETISFKEYSHDQVLEKNKRAIGY